MINFNSETLQNDKKKYVKIAYNIIKKLIQLMDHLLMVIPMVIQSLVAFGIMKSY